MNRQNARQFIVKKSLKDFCVNYIMPKKNFSHAICRLCLSNTSAVSRHIAVLLNRTSPIQTAKLIFPQTLIFKPTNCFGQGGGKTWCKQKV